MLHKILKKIRSKDVKDTLHRFKKEITRIKQGMSDDNYRLKYEEVRQLFISMSKELFSIEGVITPNELLDEMGTSNIGSGVIERAKKFFDRLVEVDYSFYDFTKEDLFDLIEDCELLYEDIYNHRIGDMISKEENISKFQKGMILNSFNAAMDKIKRSYARRGKITEKQVLKATEYYEKLDTANKSKHSKEFHDYCVNIYHILYLLEDLKEDNKSSIEKTHILISKINKIFFKLDEDQRNKLYPVILNMVDSHEEKLNFYIFGGYEYIHKKDYDSAKSLYHHMRYHFDNLDDEKKRFYSKIISRFADTIKNEIRKKERKKRIFKTQD